MYNRTLAGKIELITHHSQVLDGNPLGDPTERQFPVYLPPDYSPTGQPYPVIYALAGFTGTGPNMTNYAVWDETVPEQLDDLITSGESPPAIMVMPDCFTKLGGSQYINSPATGRYDDYLVGELVPFINGTFNVHRAAAQRAVMGKSSGGYGALVLAMRHPDVFGLCASISGDMYFQYGYQRDFPAAVDTINQYGGVEGFLAEFEKARQKGKLIPTLNIIAMAAAYAAGPGAIELPFDLATGEIREDVWSRWLEHDPINMVEQHQAALRQLAMLHIEAGSKDEFALHLGGRMFVKRLKQLGIDHTYEEFPDGHFGINYRYRPVMQQILQHFT